MLGVIIHSGMWPVPSFLLGSTCKLRDAKELLSFWPRGNEPTEQRESGERDPLMNLVSLVSADVVVS